jgi:hypothetical protein
LIGIASGTAVTASFRDLLRRKLVDEEPELVPVLNARAAEWFEAHDGPESALGYARAAGDTDGAARILSSIALKVHQSGRAATLESWLRPFDDDEQLEQYPCRGDQWLPAPTRSAAARKKRNGGSRRPSGASPRGGRVWPRSDRA